jgi:hypothetical protein
VGNARPYEEREVIHLAGLNRGRFNPDPDADAEKLHPFSEK